jgi:hypothetical protein
MVSFPRILPVCPIITLAAIIQRRPVLYLKHDVLETRFCLRLAVEIAHMSKMNKAGLCFWTNIPSSQTYNLPSVGHLMISAAPRLCEFGHYDDRLSQVLRDVEGRSRCIVEVQSCDLHEET